MIKKIHSSHIGINGCIRRAKDVMYWPGMSSQIKDVIENCDTCNTTRQGQRKEPMLPHPIPDRPWQRVGADIFERNHK